MDKKSLILICMTFLFGILLASFLTAAETSYCCEKLKDNGPWCQNAPQSACATGTNILTDNPFQKAPTSCEATSYCKLGTCIDTNLGTCMPNTAQVVCTQNEGTWKEKKIEDLPECQLGCCLLGNQAVFATQTECKKLSSDAGLETMYRADITNELECIAMIDSGEMGACVFEKESASSCLMTTQTECNDIKKASYTGEEDVSNINRETIEFHKGFLCSASELGTTCGPSKTITRCYEENVYFTDTCGNLANIYDASKINEVNYWTYIQEPSCGDGAGNKNSPACGSCDYFSGSVCKDYVKGKSPTAAKPTYGNSFCSSLDCVSVGKKHGETWCVENTKPNLKDQNLPGSRDFKMMCYNGEVIINPCAEFRNEICVETEINDYSHAACVVNKWQDCINQTNPDDCGNDEERYCKWISGYSILKDKDGKDLSKNKLNVPGSCVPKYTPGFDFWSEEGYGPEMCSLGTSTCVVQYETNIFESREKFSKWSWATKAQKCVANCYCIPGYGENGIKTDRTNEYAKTNPQFATHSEWLRSMNSICSSLGDCGNKNNYLGKSGDIKEVITNEFIKKP